MRAHRGIAMLIAIMTMTVLIAGVTIIARVQTTDRLVELHGDHMTMAHDLIRSAEGPIQSWLKEKAHEAVVDPVVNAPMIPVSDDQIVLNDQEIRIEITAWDQSGMIPRNADELGIDIEGSIEIPWNEARFPGLDLSTQNSTVFPSREHPAALGGLNATHNPWPTRSGTTRSRNGAAININTAPTKLLEHIFTAYNLGDPSGIFDSRAQGEPATLSLRVQDARQMSVRLVSISRVWSFRVDVSIGRSRRSCWCVYANQGGRWKLVQRIGIDDD